MTVSYKEYETEKRAFIKKYSKYDWEVETSSMDNYGRYYETYIFENGKMWYEAITPEWVTETVEIRGAKCKVEVKMFRTEFWNSDDASSKYYYEQF